MRLWLAPRDLSAVSSVVLISRVPVPGTTVRGRLGLVCAEVLKWVVGDLSTASAAVLISPVDSLCSECGYVRGTHFIGLSLDQTPPV